MNEPLPHDDPSRPTDPEGRFTGPEDLAQAARDREAVAAILAGGTPQGGSQGESEGESVGWSQAGGPLASLGREWAPSPGPGATPGAFAPGSYPPGEPDPDADHRASKRSPRKRRLRTLVFETTLVFVLAIGLALVLRTFIAQAYEIRGDSMNPTLHDGERVMISKLSPVLDGLEYGDIVIFADPKNAARDLIKRVVALPGDGVRVDGNRVTVNGIALQEDYVLRDQRDHGIRDERVRADQIYVLGDNRGNSKDSRDFGPIPVSSVRGRVFLRLWPLNMIEWLD